MPRHRAKPAICNCPATRELYGKSFPHGAGKVNGCHMGPDGQALDGVPRPGCHCRACNATNSVLNAGSGNAWSAADLQEQWGGAARKLPWPEWMGKNAETAFANWQAHNAGVEA